MPPCKCGGQFAVRENSRAVGHGKRPRDFPSALLDLMEAVLTELKNKGTRSVNRNNGNNVSYMHSTVFETGEFETTAWNMSRDLTIMLNRCGVPLKFLVIAWIYILRASVETPDFKVTKWNVQSVFTTSAMVAAKYVDGAEEANDNYYVTFCYRADRTPHKMKLLEEGFLHLIGGKFRVRSQEIASAEKEMIRKALNTECEEMFRSSLTRKALTFRKLP